MDIISSTPRPDDKTFNRFFKGIIIAQIVIGAVGLTLIGGGIYIMCHFLAKIW